MGGRLSGRALADEPLRRSHRFRPAGEEVSDDPLDSFVEVLGDLVHEPDPERGVGVEALAGEEVAARRARADAREHEGRDDGRNDPQAHFREAEDRIEAGDGHVGAGDDARAAAEGEPLNTGDDGRRASVDRLEHPVEPHRVRDVLVVGEVDRGALPLHVRSGAEARPVTG